MRFSLPISIVALALFAATACSDGDASRSCETAVNCFNDEICYAGFCTPAPGDDAGEDLDTEAPDTEEPDTDAPDSEVPDADEPDADEPDADVPDAEEPDADAPDDSPYVIEVTWTSSGSGARDLNLHYCLAGATQFVSEPSPLCVNEFKPEDDWLEDTTPVSVSMTEVSDTTPGPERVEHAPMEAATSTYVGVMRNYGLGENDLTATLRIHQGDTLLFERERVLDAQGQMWFGAEIIWSADGSSTITEGPDCSSNCASNGLYLMPVPLP